ncbi:MAG: hypothetical protein OEW12_04265 [Deltaproteobacteria bacterium]|nr:hypothetical protein [Deltaproteobacteria bacterium]
MNRSQTLLYPVLATLKGWAGGTLLVILLLGPGVSPARAGEYGLDDGWFAGVGAASNTIGGDFSKTFPMTCHDTGAQTSGCPIALATGQGLALEFGKRVLDNLTLETMYTYTNHKAADATLADTAKVSARVATVSLGVRGMIPFSENSGFFVRGGVDAFNLIYSNNVCSTASAPSTCDLKGGGSTFSGGGGSLGLGFELAGKNLGVEASITRHSGSVTAVHVNSGQQSSDKTLAKNLDLTQTTAQLMLIYHL